INYLLMLACVALAAALLDNPLAGKLVSLPIVAINGYLLSKHWIYK
ncbi:GtrA family protein, partial [Acinetobacter baumannii]|nr:GtrA family protein [Acinetobacter baumannii]